MAVWQHFQREIKTILLPLPPIEELGQIFAEVERRLSIVDEIETEVTASLKRAARLRQGILRQAFEGRLVPQDPSDEPAEKLVERIRQRTTSSGRVGQRSHRVQRSSNPIETANELPFATVDSSRDGRDVRSGQ
jgi:type I restriction enzyme, S subunit